MKESRKGRENNIITINDLFLVPYIPKIKKQINVVCLTNNRTKSKKEGVKEAIDFHLKGNISEAETFYQIFLNRGFSDARVNSNLGQIYIYKGNIWEIYGHVYGKYMGIYGTYMEYIYIYNI